jgi:hypothetical protein
LVELVTGSAAEVEVHASWVDNASGTMTPGRTNTADITTATTTTVVGSPASSTQRNVKALSIFNRHASTSTTVTVRHTDGTNVETLFGCNLLAGESLHFDRFGRWTHFLTSGEPYAAIGQIATAAEMETGTATDRVVTPSVLHRHPGMPKCWGKANTSGSLSASYNMTSVTDDGTGLITFTIATDFSSADWCCVMQIERAATSLAEGSTAHGNIRSAAQAAGTVQLEAYDNTTGTSGQDDPTSWFMAGFGDQ